MKRDRFLRPVLNPVALFRHWFSLENHLVSFWRDQILIGITLLTGYENLVSRIDCFPASLLGPRCPKSHIGISPDTAVSQPSCYPLLITKHFVDFITGEFLLYGRNDELCCAIANSQLDGNLASPNGNQCLPFFCLESAFFYCRF